jgi:hypothetical protein
MNQGPMSFSGIDVDPVSGTPVDPVEREGNRAELDRIERRINEANELIADLAGEGGKMVQLTVRLLARRIDALMTSDPECVAYLNVLSQIKTKLEVARKMAERAAMINATNIVAPSGDSDEL